MNTDLQPISTTTPKSAGGLRRILPGLIAVLLLALPPAVHLNAQPVPVPALGTPGYQPTDFDPFFNTAQGSATQASWETLIDQARVVLGAQWEAQVDATIGAHVAAVGQNDYFHTPQEYRDYLTKELHLQKQTAFAAWEAQADVQIEIQRETFLAALSERKKREALEESEQTTEQADTTQVDLGDQQDAWENEFGEAVENGFQQFQSALGDVYSQYTSFLQTLADKEQEFEQNRLQIEAYEQTVRDGIQNTVYALDSYLQSNGLFREENCTTTGAAGTQSTSCTTDMATYNTAGTRLQTLITNLQDGLDNDTPLSTLATLMNDYLDQEHTDAITRRDYWGGLIRNAYTYSKAEYVTHGNPYPIPDVASVFEARNSGYATFTGLTAMIAAKGDPRVVEGINWADLRGYSHNYIAGPDQVGHSNFQNEWYSTHGDNAFRFNWERRHTYWYNCGGFPCQGSYTSHHTANESHLEIQASYNWYDPNADHNNQVWGGYVNDMAPVLANWRDNIVPAIQNWEAQVATYTANHQAYLADAQTKRDAATTQFNTSMDTLTESRNKWLSQMQEEFRKGRNEWVSMGRTARSANATPAVVATAVSEAASFENQIALLQKQAEASAASAPVPDATALDGLQSAFQKASKGIINLSLAATLNDQVVEQRTAITESIAAQIGANGLDGISEEKLREMAQKQADQTGRPVEEIIEAMRKDANDRQYDVRIDENGRIIATRQIKSGNVGGSTGDGTGYNDYTAEMMEQELVIAPPPAIQLVKTGGAFDDWDLNSYVNDHYENQQAQTEILENYNKYVAGEQEIADELREVQDIIYNANVEASMTAAQNRKAAKEQFSSLLNSVASAMMGGASFSDAFGAASNEQLSNEIARITGIPSNFFNGVLNGESWQSALTDATEFLMTDYVTKAVVEATGLPAGFISGIAGPGGLDMSGEGMKASFQNYSEQLFAETLEKQTGIPGLGALALSKHKEHQAERERVDSERKALVGFATGHPAGWAYAATHVMKHTPVGREVTNQALGILNGSTMSNATGTPSALWSPLGGILPANVDELDELAGDVFNIVEGNMDGRELGEKFQDRFDGWVDSNIASVEDLGQLQLADLPGRIGQGITGYLSAGMGMIMKPLTALTNPPDEFSPEELVVRESLAMQVSEATGQNHAYLMAVARGESYEDAAYAQAYDDAATSIYGDNIPPQFRDQVVGTVRDYTEHTLERLEFQRQRERARNDPLNIWRNAEYGSRDQQLALQAAEIGAGVAASVATAGWAAPAFIGYMAAKGAYTGSGDGGGGIGALAGAASAVVSQVTPVNLDLKYSEEDGFSGSVGFGVPIGEQELVNVGGGITFSQNEGITGANINLGVKAGKESKLKGASAGLDLNFAADGTFTGGSASASFTRTNKKGTKGGKVALGIDFDHSLSYTSASIDVSATLTNKDIDGGYFDNWQSDYTAGLGLTMNRDGSYATRVKQSVSLYNDRRRSFGGSVDSTLTQNYSNMGDFETSTISMKHGVSITSEDEAQQGRLKYLKEKLEEMGEFEIGSPEWDALYEQYDEIADEHWNNDVERAKEKHEAEIKAGLMAAGMSEAEAIGYMQHADRHTDGWNKMLKAMGLKSDTSDGTGPLDKAWAWMKDETMQLLGFRSRKDGYVDPETGIYHEKTCFVAGTPVRVHPDTRGAYESNGSWYKDIEEVEAGDIVMSWNEDSGEVGYNPVAQTFVRDTDLIYEVTYADGTQVETTWNHPFYIDGRGWTQVKDLRVDDVSVAATQTADGRMLATTISQARTASAGISSAASPHRIARIVKSARDEVVYNFEVGQDHTYFVTDADVLVHNQGGPYPSVGIGPYLNCYMASGNAEHCRKLAEMDQRAAVLSGAATAVIAGATACAAGGCQALAAGSGGLIPYTFSWLQVNAPWLASATGVSASLSRTSVRDKLARYLLNPSHPVGGPKARWFESALGFTSKNGSALARQIVFDPKSAVKTAVTEHGTKYNQVISILGANGRKIDVTFAWIKNNDGVVRLVTSIPAKK
ncbi:MAG: TIGR04388 family protein [bacterium]|nr:TIGR04388 family protein [bacterium]